MILGWVKIEFKNVHNILEPIVDKVEPVAKPAPAKEEESSSDDSSDSDDEEKVVEKVADKVEAVLVEKVVEKVEEVVDKKVVEKVEEVVDKVDDLVTKVEQLVDNVNEVIQMEETPKVEGMLDQKTWILHKSRRKLTFVFASSYQSFFGIALILSTSWQAAG